jgi:hypothetical protein
VLPVAIIPSIGKGGRTYDGQVVVQAFECPGRNILCICSVERWRAIVVEVATRRASSAGFCCLTSRSTVSPSHALHADITVVDPHVNERLVGLCGQKSAVTCTHAPLEFQNCLPTKRSIVAGHGHISRLSPCHSMFDCA